MKQRFMLARAVSAACASLLAPVAGAAATLPAFPGAEGAGANAVGGRAGDVYRVTNLNDSGAGSLRNGIAGAPAAGRTIVFDVGGVITLQSKLNVNKPKVTIAGQTAPGPGVILRGKSVYISGSDNVVRYVRNRVGRLDAYTNDEEDGISVIGGTNVIVDHSSAAWSNDEAMSVTNTAQNVTLQYNFITEALNWDGHSYGSLIRPEITASYSLHHNLYAHNWSRNPRPGTYNDQTVNLDFRNNVLYNWGDQAGYSGAAGEHVNLNYVGNYLVAGPDTPGSKTTRAFNGGADNPVIYQSDNKIDSDKDQVHDGANTGWSMFVGTYTQQATPFPAAAVTTDSPDVAYEKVLASAGAFPWARDVVDARISNDVLTENTVDVVPGHSAVKILQDETNVGGYPAVAPVSRAAGWDTDNDGMPNWWETARGLNPNSPAAPVGSGENNATTLTPGSYTNLEHYLNYLTLFAHWNRNGDATWDTILNWRGTLPDGADATAVFGNGITAARTITVANSKTVGQIGFDSAHAYTITGGGTITMDVISGAAAIDVGSGSHAIGAPLALANDLGVNVAPAGSTLTLGAMQPTTAFDLIKSGAGKLAVNRARVADLVIGGGTVQVIGNGTSSGTSRVASVSVAGGGKLDLTDNKLVVAGGSVGAFNTSTGSYGGVTGMVQAGRNGGAWTGSGIVTSQSHAATGLTTLAVARAADTGYAGGTFGGVSVAASDVLVMYTYGGDADLSGALDSDDYFAIDSNFNLSGSVFGYTKGDFDYNGVIDSDDYFIIDSNFNNQILGQFPGSGPEPSATAQPVPEPAIGAALACLFAGSLATRRRRN